MTEDEKIIQYFGFVRKIVKSFHPRSYFDLEDYLQEGYIALLRAMRKHDSKNGKLSTLAHKYITRALINYIKKNKKIVLFPYQEEVIADIIANVVKIPERDYQLNISEYLPDNLSSVERLVIEKISYGYTYKEIAKEINYHSKSIGKIYKRAIKKIQKANE